MVSCTSALSVLLVMAVTLCTVCESAVPTVKVKLHDSAVLPCSGRCTGVIRWSMFSNSSDVLSECDQTSCRSVKEGYQMIYKQYLLGDFSLIITEADFSKRGLYVCDCDETDLCDVRLQIKTLNSTVYKKVGETLVLELDVSNRLEVIYSSTDPAKPSSRQFCRMDRRSVEFGSDYKQRASLTSDLELRGMKESDSGIYTVQDILNDEIIHIYTVTVHGDSKAHGQEHSDTNSFPLSDCQGAALPGWVVPVLVVLVVVCVVCVVSVVVNVVLWRKKQRLQRISEKWEFTKLQHSNHLCDKSYPEERENCLL